MNEEITKHMIRTPYGILSMSVDLFVRFSVATEQEQWSALEKCVKAGQFQKARAMQWFWTQSATRGAKTRKKEWN